MYFSRTGCRKSLSLSLLFLHATHDGTSALQWSAGPNPWATRGISKDVFFKKIISIILAQTLMTTLNNFDLQQIMKVMSC